MKKIILCIDSDPAHYALFSAALLKIEPSYILQQVKDEEEAFRFLSETSPHFIFIDSGSESINAFEIFEKIRNNPRLQHAKIILYAPAGDFSIAEKAKLAGVMHIRKPYLINTFTQLLKKILLF